MLSHAARYPLPIRLLHWGMALLIVGMLALGLTMTSVPDDDPDRRTMFSLHKSLGVMVLALIIVRIAVRMTKQVPELPPEIPAWQQRAAHFSHYLLYILMAAMPLSGIAMSQGMGFGVKFFGLTLPRIFPVDRTLGLVAGDVHEVLAYLLIAVIALHIAGVVQHWLVHRLNLLKRIW